MPASAIIEGPTLGRVFTPKVLATADTRLGSDDVRWPPWLQKDTENNQHDPHGEERTFLWKHVEHHRRCHQRSVDDRSTDEKTQPKHHLPSTAIGYSPIVVTGAPALSPTCPTPAGAPPKKRSGGGASLRCLL